MTAKQGTFYFIPGRGCIPSEEVEHSGSLFQALDPSESGIDVVLQAGRMIPEWRDRILLRGAEDSHGTYRVKDRPVWPRKRARNYVR